jgi:3-hydroxymyristoyl/3-hydroxydecanoyl-(acyl carrier protein) dehydratase
MHADDGRPQVLGESRPSATRLRRELFVQPELAWFEGHFPGEPVLAGVVQIKWAIEAAAVLLGESLQPVSLQQLKFKSPILAGFAVELELELLAGSVVVFSYSSAKGVHSSGRFQF